MVWWSELISRLQCSTIFIYLRDYNLVYIFNQFGGVNYYLGYNALQYSYISEIIICSRYLLWFGRVNYYLGYNALQYSYISEIIICSRYLL